MFTFNFLSSALLLNPVFIQSTENKHLRFFSFSQVKGKSKNKHQVWLEQKQMLCMQTRSSTVLQYVHSSEYTTYNCPRSAPPLFLRRTECSNRYQKIEMYKKSKNNSYRKSISKVCQWKTRLLIQCGHMVAHSFIHSLGVLSSVHTWRNSFFYYLMGPVIIVFGLKGILIYDNEPEQWTNLGWKMTANIWCNTF